MADEEDRRMLRRGADYWNKWREKNRVFQPDLVGVDFSTADLSYVNLRGSKLAKSKFVNSNLMGADLSETDLMSADFRGANLCGAKFIDSDLHSVNMSGANLRGAYCTGAKFNFANLTKAEMKGAEFEGVLFGGVDLNNADLSQANLEKAGIVMSKLISANLHEANLSQSSIIDSDFSRANLILADLSSASIYRSLFLSADLGGANFTNARLVGTSFENADLWDCRIYGVSVWDVNLKGANQLDLIITRPTDPIITVDNLEVAQFIYLLLNNEKIRDIIDTIARKVVLILGRFTPERKVILNSIREELRKLNYMPVLFDFEKPVTRDMTETVRTLSHLSRFIIADITDPSSIPLELQSTVPDLAIPVLPIVMKGKSEFSMFVDLRKKYHWVLATYQYQDLDELLASLKDKIIVPAEEKARELDKR